MNSTSCLIPLQNSRRHFMQDVEWEKYPPHKQVYLSNSRVPPLFGIYSCY